MPFEQIPSRNLNFPTPLRPVTYPQRPVFPTYQVVMDALKNVLPAIDNALDPAAREKKKLFMETAQLEHAQNQDAIKNLPLTRELIQRELENKKKEYDYQDKVRDYNLKRISPDREHEFDSLFGPSTGLDTNPSQISLDDPYNIGPPGEGDLSQAEIA